MPKLSAPAKPRKKSATKRQSDTDHQRPVAASNGTLELTIVEPGHIGARMQLLNTRLEIIGEMGFEQWQATLRGWQRAADLFHIGLADLIAYGRRTFGEEKVDEALELFNFDMADVLKAHAIGQLSLDLRTEGLTSEHYYVLSKSLPGAKKDQGKWAAIANKEHLSATELKASIEKGKITRQTDVEASRGSGSGVPNIEGLSLVFQRWAKNAGGEEQILKQSDEWKQQFLNEVHPIVELAQKVESTLKDGIIDA